LNIDFGAIIYFLEAQPGFINPKSLCVCVVQNLSPFQFSSCFGVAGDNTTTSTHLIILLSLLPPFVHPPIPSISLSFIIYQVGFFFCRHNQSVWQCKHSLLLPVSLFLHQQETTINTDRKWEQALTL